MSVRFVNIDHDNPMLLPPDLRDWVKPDHMVHFIMDAVLALNLTLARVNQRGSGSAQYPPFMMLGLLIYCYATGTFASRRIETLTYENLAVRYLCCNTHSDFHWLISCMCVRTGTDSLPILSLPSTAHAHDGRAARAPLPAIRFSEAVAPLKRHRLCNYSPVQ
jgi:hypothetical protein